MGFARVGSDVDLPALEDSILEFWDEIGAFEASVELRPENSEYTFYDGPPFPTGSPHYGNLLAGVLKDIVPRYWTMRGHRVVRRFGWDTHGLPIEMEVQRELGLNGPSDIERIGVAAFNEACRQKVMANTEVWEAITRRIGRWVDFRNDYRTMDLDFMESVWWVFRRLWDKGLIYKDLKVVPYSYGASTPLSNFEANSDYRDVDDPAITVRLAVTEGHGPAEAGDFFLIWTTTPWTLPGNLAIAVGSDIEYARVEGDIDGHAGTYWVAAELVSAIWPDGGADVRATASGAELLAAAYEPPFDYFADLAADGAFRIIASADVNTEEGTGLVHMAPAYGEADFLAFQEAGLDLLVDPVDAEGKFTDEAPDVAGRNVKEADATLMDLLKVRGRLVRHSAIRHSYPFCPRTGTPLIYKAIPTWYVRVESIRDRMAELNKTVHWVPEYVGSRRFGNWIADARDWAVSRNRYWGSCIPVWECDGCDETTCVGSVDELESFSGVRLDDLHKHFVDPITFPCTSCDGTMRRVPEVLDVWFDSGSMPYAQVHYPFENAEAFARKFPADYIAEGLDQTRGWFYTLLVHSTAIFDSVPFQNCVVNGLILAEDGRKMSKSLRNYPDPFEVIGHNGADALRAYLLNSPLMRAEPLRFSEDGVREVVRSVLLPFWNAYSFFTTYAVAGDIDLEALGSAPEPPARAEIDRWILSVLQSLIRSVNREMEGYYLYNVIPPLLGFIEDLTNWYIRLSRRRFWRTEGDSADELSAFATLYDVLVTFSKLLAPVLPFVTEEVYQALAVRPGAAGAAPSVHHTDYPIEDPALIHPDLERDMAAVRAVVQLGRSLRVQEGVKIRQPLQSLTVVSRDRRARAAVAAHTALISDELNVVAVEISEDEESLVHLSAKANFAVLGPRLGAQVKDVAAAIAEMPPDRIADIVAGGTATVAGVDIGAAEIVIERTPQPEQVVATAAGLSVTLDMALSPELEVMGVAREIINRIQGLRRQQGLDVSDRIRVRWAGPGQQIAAAFRDHGELIAAEVLAAQMINEPKLRDGASAEVAGESVRLALEVAG